MRDNLYVADARIVIRNFAGKATKFSPAGTRTFHVIFDIPTGERLKEDGWNVKWWEPREEGDEVIAHLEVTVNYKNFPPKIVLITGKNQTELNADTVERLDRAEIKKVDLVIRPYNWDVNGKSGVKAYVKSMFVTIVEDPFEAHYREMLEEDDSA
jgi:hypothetical protein